MPSIFQLEGPRLAAPYAEQPKLPWFLIGALTVGAIGVAAFVGHRVYKKGLGSPRDIAQRSRDVEDYATRVEAWASGEAKPPSIDTMAKAYRGAKPARVKRLIRQAREQRLESRETLWSRMGRGLRGNGYRVAYLDRGKRVVTDHPFDSIEPAASMVRAYKRRGFTVWVEDDAGNFVPVKGAMKLPKSL